MKLSLLFTVPFALVLAAGCSKPNPDEQKKREEDLAAALASAMAAPATSTSVTSANVGSPAAAAGGIQATCNNKGDGKCTETLGAEGLGAADSCKTLGGVYAKGSAPCPQENVLGTCTRSDSSSGLNDVDYYYKQAGSDGDAMKSLCEGVMSGKWAVPAKAAPAKAAPAAKTPAKKK